MKNRFGLIIGVCTAILVVGALFSYGFRHWGAFPLNFLSYSFSSPRSVSSVTANGIAVSDLTTPHTETLPLDPFTSVKLNVRAAHVTVVPGDTFALEYHYYGEIFEMTYTQENGVLTVIDDYAAAFRSSGGSRQSGFGEQGVVYKNFSGNTLTNSIQITCPAGTELTTLEGKISSGDCDISGPNVRTLDMECSYGDLSLRGNADYTSESIRLRLSSGDAKLRDLRTAQFSLDDDYGEAELQDIHAETGEITMSSGALYLRAFSGDWRIQDDYGSIEGKDLATTGLQINASSGDIDLKGSFTGLTDFSSSYGSVEIELDQPRDQYNLDLFTSYGAIAVDGETVVDDEGEDKDRLREDKNAPQSLKIDCSSGDIEVTFR